MLIKLKINKNLHENAGFYYEQAKEMKKKITGVEKAIEETKKELINAEKQIEEKRKQIKVKKEKKWYEKFHFFFTQNGKLAIGGKDAKQNDFVFTHHMEDADLFFHADIQGASVIILKEGVSANSDELLEAAQFAASFSNAWKNGNADVDVYAVTKEQLAKHVQGGYIPSGAFAISGERLWFKGTRLAIRIGFVNDELVLLPQNSKKKLLKEVMLYPAKTGKEKGEIAKMLAKRFSIHPDILLQILPSGKCKVQMSV